MKQNTGDMSASKALSGSQRHLPKYLHLLLLFIHRQGGALLLVFGGASTFPIYSSSQRGKKKEKKMDVLDTFRACLYRRPKQIE